MKITITTGIAGLCVGTGLYGLAMAGPFENGIDAARRADYETVLRLWRPLAEQGDAKAQTALARVYAQGRGVPRDYAAAIGWYRKAAEGEMTNLKRLSRAYTPTAMLSVPSLEAWRERSTGQKVIADHGFAAYRNHPPSQEQSHPDSKWNSTKTDARSV
jgi:hypothetical protein